MDILTVKHIHDTVPLLVQLAAKHNLTEKETVELIRNLGFKPTPQEEKE